MAITEETKVALPLWAICSIIVALFTGVGSLVGGVSAYNHVTYDVNANKEKLHDLADQMHQHDLRDNEYARHFEKLDNAVERLSRVDERISSIERSLSIIAYKNKVPYATGTTP